VLLFSASLGFLWLATVPLTSGPRRLHVRFDAHLDAVGHGVLQPSARELPRRLGAPAGSTTSRANYDMMWWISVGLGLVRCRHSLVHSAKRPVPAASRWRQCRHEHYPTARNPRRPRCTARPKNPARRAEMSPAAETVAHPQRPIGCCGRPGIAALAARRRRLHAVGASTAPAPLFDLIARILHLKRCGCPRGSPVG